MSSKDALILALAERDRGVQEELSRLHEYARRRLPGIYQAYDRLYKISIFNLYTNDSTQKEFSGFQLREHGDLLIARNSPYCCDPICTSFWECVTEIHIIHSTQATRFEIFASKGHNGSDGSELLLSIDISPTRLECIQHKPRPTEPMLHQVFENPCISELNLAARLQAWLESVELDCKFIHKHIN